MRTESADFFFFTYFPLFFRLIKRFRKVSKMNNVSELTAQETEKIKTYLEGIKESLSARKGMADKSSLLTEEEAVLNSIINPERGDIKITLMRDKKETVIFVNNQRDPENPFVVMNYADQKRFSGRRPLNTLFRNLKEGEHALYISSGQDKELLANTGITKIVFYLTQITETQKAQVAPTSGTDHLKTKPLAECTVDEKFIIYKRGWGFDTRMNQITAELFTLELLFARYNQPVKKELINIEPLKFKVSIHQMIRDVYPYNIRVLLRKEFPEDHEKKLQEVMDILKTLLIKIEEKSEFAGDGDYGIFLKEVSAFAKDIAVNDPKLEKVV
jgi:hypothetical protein